MDQFLLSRLQFAANISFHIIFPSITIALGWILLFFKIRYTLTKNYKWMESYFFFTKIFALSFAIGVVSGIPMSFQFGTNWPGYMQKVGNIAGPLLAYEVLTAFFLEATFLGIMLFGFRKTPAWLHNLATFLVAFGTTISAFWILALNSWMQTPAGYEIIDGVVHAKNWLEIIFNPSFPYRLIHMLLASGLTASFLVAGVSAFCFLHKGKTDAIMAALKTGIFLAAILAPLQILMGDLHGLNTLKYQPQKIAAMEGLWETTSEAPLLLFAIPNEKNHTNNFEIKIPKLASLILTHDSQGEVKGINEFENHPPVTPVFFAFRIMVGIGFLMLLVSSFCAFNLFLTNNLNKFLAYILVAMSFSGCIAVLAGWYVTEIGRQPWLVTGILKTIDAASSVPPQNIMISLVGYLSVYLFLLVAYIKTIFHMAKKFGETNSDFKNAKLLASHKNGSSHTK